jgi:hypothetical protein
MDFYTYQVLMGFGKGSYSFLYLDIHHIMTEPNRYFSLPGMMQQQGFRSPQSSLTVIRM